MKLKSLHLTITLFLCLSLLLGGLTWPAPARAQDRRAGGPNYWRHYDVADGLLSNNVQAIAYTEDEQVDVAIPGLWIGTDAGLSYTNGREWEDYTVQDGSLPGNDVRAILNGRQAGELWIATSAGVVRLGYAGTPLDRQDDPSPQIFTRVLPEGEVRCLALGEGDEVWAGTTKGLARYDGAGWHVHGLLGSEIRDLLYDAEQEVLWVATNGGVAKLDLVSDSRDVILSGSSGSELPDDDVRALALSDDGRTWMGTAGGLAALSSDESWQTWTPGKPGLPNYPITDLSIDPSGRYLWVATDGGGVSRYDIPTGHWMRLNTLGSDLPNNRVRVVLASHEGTAWLGTVAGLSGVERPWETYSFLAPRVPGRLASHRVQAGWVDPETGTVWVGTDGGGVGRSDDEGASWQVFSMAHGLGSNNVRAVWGDGAGTVWVGTLGGGASRSDDGGATWQTFTTQHGLQDNDVLSVWGDSAGIVWVGTWGGGASRSADGGATWQTFTLDYGLQSNNVWSVWGDGVGTVWVGTAQGVSRSNDEGTSWDTSTTNHGLGANDVWSVWGDDAEVWAGTLGGVSRSVDGGTTWQTFTTTHGLESDDVRAVWGDGAGTIWVGTRGGGVSRSADGGMTWQTFTTTHGLESNYVSSVWGGRANTVWVGIAGGISRSADGATWQTVTVAEGLGSDYVSSVWGDGAGTIWVGTFGGGVSRSADGGQSWQTFTTVHGLGSNSISSVWGDGAGTIWVTTEGGGASRSEDGGATWQTFNTAAGLGDNDVTAVWEDSTGVLWVGTLGNGISRSQDGGATWEFFTTADGLESNFVISVWEDDAGVVWVGTDNGLNRSEDSGASWQTFTAAESLGVGWVNSVWRDNAGVVWVGTDNGLKRSADDGASWETFTTADGLGDNNIALVWGDSAGVIWVGTSGGLSRSADDGATWQTSTTAAGLRDNWITSAWRDGTGTVWVGTYGGLSYSEDGGATWQTFSTSEGLGSNYVSAVWEDSAAAVWVGTSGGLKRSVDGGATWETFTTSHGLGTSDVNAVWGDDAGLVWAGTSSGLSRSEDGGATWQTFTMADGLGSNYIHSVWGDERGVWAGTFGGGLSYSADGGATWQTFTTTHGLGADDIRSVWGDGVELWAGTYGGGVSRSEDGGTTWQTFTTTHGLGSDDVISVWGDGAGVVWVGTRDGVSRSEDGRTTWETFTTTHGLGGDFILSIRGDARDAVWVGTRTGGVSRSADGGKTWQPFTTRHGLGSNVVQSVWEDSAGVWAGTDKGVSRLTLSAGPAPAAGWLEPPELMDGSSFRLKDERTLDAQFTGLSLAPATGSDEAQYAAVLSPIATADQVVSESFAAGEIGVAGIAPVPLGDESAPLAYGDYELSLTTTDLFGNSLTTRRTLEVQALPVITGIVLYQGGQRLTPVTQAPLTPTLPTPSPSPTLSAPPFTSPLALASPLPTPLPTPTAEPPASPAPLLSGAYVLTTSLDGELVLTATLTISDPDSPPSSFAMSYTLNVPAREMAWRPLDAEGVITANELDSGIYELAFRAADPDGNVSLELLEVSLLVIVPPPASPLLPPPAKPSAPSPLWFLLDAALVLAALSVAILSLRHYLTYAGGWAAAQEYPLQQIIPLIAPPGEDVDDKSLRPSLRATQAFSTDEQVRDALKALVERGLMRQEGDVYRFVSPWTARVHRWIQGRRVSVLAERIRTQHPLYARTRSFFDQARFRMTELGAEEFMLSPQGQDHPQARYGLVYARLVTGRPPTGDDFTSVYEAARERYGDNLTHRVAVVISDRRPEPGARYRLYEIRQRVGLAIVPLDSALFGQIKPNRSASDILGAEIDQATGQQNLYAISGPVSGDLSFFGRERLLQDVIDLLDAGQPLGVFGLRKVGKTSLIQRMQGRLSEWRPIAFVDTQGTIRQQGVWPFYSTIIAAFVDHLERYRPDFALPDLRLYPQAQVSGPATADAFLQDLEALHEALGRPGEKERLLLIMDEVDRLLPFGTTPGYEGLTGFLGQLRAANQQARLLDLMLVGVDPALNRRERWGDHDNELYRALHEVWMPPMALKDVREMIESLGLQMGVRYGRQALARLARAGGGHPFVTRQMCSRAVQDRLGKGTIRVTVPQAESAIEEFIFQDPYLPEMWRTRLDDAGRETLRRLARATEAIPRADLLPATQRQAALATLGALEERTLVERTKDGYVIAWDVFRDWIRWVELGLENGQF